RAARGNAPDPRRPRAGRLAGSRAPRRRRDRGAARKRSMTNAGRACVVLPTYDERENLPAIVPAILATSPELDVLVVGDACPAGSGPLADQLAARRPRV